MDFTGGPDHVAIAPDDFLNEILNRNPLSSLKKLSFKMYEWDWGDDEDGSYKISLETMKRLSDLPNLSLIKISYLQTVNEKEMDSLESYVSDNNYDIEFDIE